MAKQVITTMLDDLEGGKATQTVPFSVDGVQYEIDLNDKNAAKLRDFLEPFIEAGVRVGRVASASSQSRPASRYPTASRDTREENQKIRVWATKNGYQLSERGRIPQTIVEAYSSGTPHPAHAAKLKAEALAEEAKPAKKAAPAKKATAAAFSA